VDDIKIKMYIKNVMNLILIVPILSF